MNLVSFADFGSRDELLYREYLRANVVLRFSSGTAGGVALRDGRAVVLGADVLRRRVDEVLAGTFMAGELLGAGRSGVDEASGGGSGGFVGSAVGESEPLAGATPAGVGRGSVGAGAGGGSAAGVAGVDGSCVGAGVCGLSVSGELNQEACGVELPKRGKHYRRNKARKERARVSQVGASAPGCGKEALSPGVPWVPEWRRKRDAVKTPSLSASVCTVDTRTAEEIEAARTLALRRTAENEVAVAVARHRLASLKNKEKTEALMRLQVARIEEQVNTTRAKSQASYKKCGSPIESVGSAMSAGEFGWKQELRKRKALQTKLEYIEAQNMELCKYASAEGLRIVSQMPEPYIPTDEEIEAEDEDISPYPSMEEMRAHAAAMCGDEYPW